MNPSPNPTSNRKAAGPLKKIIRATVGAPLAFVGYGAVLFEEWVWKKAKEGMAAVGRLPAVARMESAIRKAPPWAAALCFLVPGIAVIPFKLAAFALIAKGHAVMGAGVFVGAKATGAALVGRVWSLTEPALRKIGWINTSVNKVFDWKDRFKGWASELWPVRAARVMWKAARRVAKKAWSRWSEEEPNEPKLPKPSQAMGQQEPKPTRASERKAKASPAMKDQKEATVSDRGLSQQEAETSEIKGKLDQRREKKSLSAEPSAHRPAP